MAINFNQNSTFNLKPINKESVRGEVMGLLVNGEEIAYAFQTVRDQLIFTNKRIIAVDVQGITGKRKSFTTLPYSKIQYFSIQTSGFMEAFPDSELFLMFSSGFTATFEFNLIDSNYTLNGITGGDIEYHIKNKLPIAKAKGDKSEKESVNFFVSILEDMREAEKIAEKFVVKADES